ncbi:DUF973 family protein [Stygiolobus caldivivus]|uniref:DUF973 family protein n=1 Tax=Stygiolobus caldivivus TaxID=2824673 RepID=A0A8D5U3U0_9CREN|nr:DUF973 family protein [Stygiolobus caldivivus]BCU68763.1 hypothetical protein KN1_00600 [Stygiolobus caldivivus]
MVSDEDSALLDLDAGSVSAAIATALVSIAMINIFLLMPTILSYISLLLTPISLFNSLIVAIVAEFIASMIFIPFSVYVFNCGFRELKAKGGVTGTTLWYAGVILTMLPLIPIFIIIGLISITVGVSLIGLAIWRIGKIYNVGDIRNGVILIIIGSIVPFVGTIGYVLTHKGLGKLWDTMRTSAKNTKYTPTTSSSTSGSTQQLPVRQTGQGYIFYHGIAIVELLSTQPVKLLFARIEGTKRNSNSFNPDYLKPNTITKVSIYFGDSLEITKGKTYKVIITALVGSETLDIPVSVTGV